MTADADRRLLAPYRAVRRVSPPEDGAWSGILVRTPAGESAVLVPATELADDWAGWDAAASGHLLGPLDLVRTTVGHDVLVPFCVERLEAFIERRGGAGVPLTGGEAITIGVSLVRALAELGPRATGTNGEWWLTEQRRPVLLTGHGAVDASAQSITIAERLAADHPDHVWQDLVEFISRDRFAERDVERIEDALFSRDPAEALADAPLAPRRASSSTDELAPRRARDAATMDDAGDAVRTGWADQLSRHVDADLADMFSRATTGVWRSLRRRSGRPRRAPWLVAAGVAGIVVTGGLLWPAGGSESVAADPGEDDSASPVAIAPDPPTSDALSDQPSAASPPEPVGEPDLAALVSDLLTERTSCDGDRTCLGGTVLDPAGEFPSGVVDLEPEARTVTLVDEFGGVAVLRVDDPTGALPSQLLVVQGREREWLLRDVYAAQQP